LSDQNSETAEREEWEAYLSNPLVIAAKWGIEIQKEAATSSFVPAMRKMAEGQLNGAFDGFLAADTDDARREWQLIARMWTEILNLLNDVVVQANEAVRKLEAAEDLDEPSVD
jgi:hypothetical protein